MRFGFLELIIILGIITLLLGPKQIPKLTKAISDSAKSLKEGFKKENDIEDLDAINVDTKIDK